MTVTLDHPTLTLTLTLTVGERVVEHQLDDPDGERPEVVKDGVPHLKLG